MSTVAAICSAAAAIATVAGLMIKWWLSKERKMAKEKNEIEAKIKETVEGGSASDVTGMFDDISGLR